MAPINIESPMFYLYNVAAPGINSLFSRHIFPQGSNEIIGILYTISLCLNLYTSLLWKVRVRNFYNNIGKNWQLYWFFSKLCVMQFQMFNTLMYIVVWLYSSQYLRILILWFELLIPVIEIPNCHTSIHDKIRIES